MPTIGIVQSGSRAVIAIRSGAATRQAANCPIYDVSWGDAARFCQLVAKRSADQRHESTGTTETGAYALNGATSQAALMAVPSPSHSGAGAAAYFLPSENEWYKAAYYSGGGTNSAYYTYPTKSNTAPDNSLPTWATTPTITLATTPIRRIT